MRAQLDAFFVGNLHPGGWRAQAERLDAALWTELPARLELVLVLIEAMRVLRDRLGQLAAVVAALERAA
jgi:hypothetical protein